MSDLVAVRALIAGDYEADLGQISLSGFTRPPQVARGVRSAIAAMRLTDFGVVVADVAAVADAMALLRAAGRGRPAARTVVLLPADFDDTSQGVELVRQSAFAVRLHPVHPTALDDLVHAAAQHYLAERDHRPAELFSTVAAADRPWIEAEHQLTTLLRAAVARWTGVEVDQAIAARIARSAEAATRAARANIGDPGVLVTLAAALGEAGTGQARGAA